MPAKAKVRANLWVHPEEKQLAANWITKRSTYENPMPGDRVAWLIRVALDPDCALRAVNPNTFQMGDVIAEDARGLAILAIDHPDEFPAVWRWARERWASLRVNKIQIARFALRGLALRTQIRRGSSAFDDVVVEISHKELQSYLENKYVKPAEIEHYGTDWEDAAKKAFDAEKQVRIPGKTRQ